MADFVIDVGLRRRLGDPDKILRQIGAVILGEAQKAFADQRLGSVKWKRRYPSQSPPLLNIAGALSDFRQNKKIKARRFAGRPVGTDTGRLKLSLAPSKAGALTVRGESVVEVGSSVPYASTFNYGGVSIQPVTSGAKKNIAKWMRSLRSARRKKATYNPSTRSWGPKKGSTPPKPKKPTKGSRRGGGVKSGKAGTPKRSTGGGGGGGKFKMPKNTLSGGAKKAFGKASAEIARAEKMGFLFSRSTLRTKVVPRPFLGITPGTERKIIEIVERGLEHGLT